MKAHGNLARRQRGSSLIEVLVSLLLSAIGMLGLAGAITASIGMTKMGEHRATAVEMASDIADRMRANLEAARGGDYLYRPAFPAGESFDDTTGCRGADACAPAALAARDLAEWRLQLRQRLPSGTGYVAIGADPSVADVWVAWLDPVIGMQPPGPPNECPPGYGAANPAPRCLHLRAAL